MEIQELRRSNNVLLIVTNEDFQSGVSVPELVSASAPSDYAAGQVSTAGITLQELVTEWGVLAPAPITAQ